MRRSPARGRDLRRARPRRSRRRRRAATATAAGPRSAARAARLPRHARGAPAQLRSQPTRRSPRRPAGSPGPRAEATRVRPARAVGRRGRRGRARLGSAPASSSVRAPSLASRAGSRAAGVDAAGARQAVLGLKPHHGGAGARAEAAVDRAGPVAAAQQSPLHLAHATRAVRAGVAGAAGRRCPPTSRAETARRASLTRRRQRIADLAPVPSRRRGRVLPAANAAGAVIRASAATSAARGHLQSISSPDQSSVDRPARTPAEGRGTATRFSPGARAGR